MNQNGNNLISIQNLQVHYDLGGGGILDRITGGSRVRRVVKAVDGVSLDIKKGETLGLVGESGCGKSTLGKAILRLTEPTGGQVFYNGKDLAHLSQSAMRDERKNLQMIFQDPYASLNPRMTVGQIIGEPLDLVVVLPNAIRTNFPVVSVNVSELHALWRLTRNLSSPTNRFPL